MIYCFGEILWDVLPNKAMPGGAPMNVCINLNKLGSPATIISALGLDHEGGMLQDYLTTNHVGQQFIQLKNNLPTGKVLVNLDDPSNAIYDIVHPVAYDTIEYNLIPDIKPGETDFLLFGSLALRDAVSRETLLKLLEQPFTKVFDINLRKPHFDPELIRTLLVKSDWVKLNDDEFLEVCSWYGLKADDEQVFAKLSQEWGARLICVTKGDKGATLFYQQEVLEHPGYPVNVKDTIGAGDAFLSGLIHSFLNHKSPSVMLNNASALGAFVAGHEGGNPAYEAVDIKHFII